MVPSLSASHKLGHRFRGFLPVVIDVETGGFDCTRHALLEIAASIPVMDSDGWLYPRPAVSANVIPFAGSELDPKAMEVTGIDPGNPLRGAVDEREALETIFAPVREAVRATHCQRAILVGHNAHFDLGFLNAAIHRTGNKHSPFHPFSCFDTVSLAGLAYGQTVLSKAVMASGAEWDSQEAHSAIYDTERTAELFCRIVNRWKALSELELERVGEV